MDLACDDAAGSLHVGITSGFDIFISQCINCINAKKGKNICSSHMKVNIIEVKSETVSESDSLLIDTYISISLITNWYWNHHLRLSDLLGFWPNYYQGSFIWIFLLAANPICLNVLGSCSFQHWKEDKNEHITFILGKCRAIDEILATLRTQFQCIWFAINLNVIL